MINVKDILYKKGTDFWSVEPQSTVFEALQLMADKNIGSVLVVENNKLIGMFSERDYARKIVLHGLNSKNSAVGNFMSTEIISVKPETSIENCMALMTSRHIRHLPVLEHDNIIGVISIGDVVNAIIQEQHITIKDLESYIYGGRY